MLYLTVYTDLMPDRFSGYTIGPFILIRPKYRYDQGLLEHEKVHVRQFWCSFGLFGIAYYLSKKKRFEYEAAAFREQLKYSPGLEQKFARFLTNNYDLDITEYEALQALISI